MIVVAGFTTHPVVRACATPPHTDRTAPVPRHAVPMCFRTLMKTLFPPHKSPCLNLVMDVQSRMAILHLGAAQ